MEVEVKDVVSEANALHAGWGQSVFQSANEMVQNKMMKEKLEAVRGTVEIEKRNWEARREMSRREIEGEVPAPAERVVAKEKAAVPANKAASSDEDAVLVETPVAVEEGGGKGKKKKGKK